MSRTHLIQVSLIVAALSAAAFFSFRFWTQDSGVSDRAFFYDVSEKKLHTADRTLVPPIKGINNDEPDGMRAMVISTTGDPTDRSSWKIAYLEKYSLELKQQMEWAQSGGTSPQLSRAQALGHRFVRRLEDTRWFPMNSAEAEKILTDWTLPGPNNITPVVCTP